MHANDRHAMMKTLLVVMAVVSVVMIVDPAYAQDPFAGAKIKACEAQRGLKQLAGAVGMLGIVACLLLGFFNKLNWRWLATAIGASFALNTIPGIISWAGGQAAC
jgi:archaellum biogenesis protein FlaJ (TadC family)